MAYQTLVRPQLGYASAVWDPHTKEKTHKIEKVQRRAAHWTTTDWNRTTSVSSSLHQLNWQTLEQRRSVTRLYLLYKIVYGLVAVPLLHYIEPVVGPSRCNSINFRQLHTGKDYYKYSFFLLAIVQWNALPEYVVVSPGLESFKTTVGEPQHSKP